MNKSELNIHIVGAGISGLIAAKTLEKFGYKPIIIEASDRAGGRLKTDIVDGHQLDHGFQVLLSNYEAAQKHLDYNALNLQNFKAGACIFKNKKAIYFGDPLRDLSMLWPTMTAKIGSLSDKYKIYKLTNYLKKKSIDSIFNTAEITSLQYLKNYGFSDAIIQDFFRPFFSGIFLETALSTSSRMFEFVFKMFGEGLAVLPKEGIEAIPRQIVAQLKSTSFEWNKKVKRVSDDTIYLSNGSEIHSDYTIIATQASSLLNIPTDISWNACQCLYFICPKRNINQAFIGLLAKEDSLVNNIFYHNSFNKRPEDADQLLSVTVVKKHALNKEQLIHKVIEELREYCGIKESKFIKIYNINRALPALNQLKYSAQTEHFQYSPSVFLAGDVQLNASLNAAMESGEKAALGLIQQIKQHF